MGCVFVAGLGGGLAFRKRGHDEWLVPPAIVPRSRVGYFSIALLPHLSFFTAAYQRENGSRHYRNIRPADNLKQPERVRHLFIAPLVSAHNGDPEHLDLRRLNHHENRLQVAAAWPRTVFIDNHFAPLLSPRH